MPCSTRWMTLFAALASCAIGCGAASSSSPNDEALTVVPDRRLDLEVRQVQASNLFRLLGEASRTTVTLDACVAEKRVDARFRNAPARLIFAALGEQLGLAYQREGATLHVRCGS